MGWFRTVEPINMPRDIVVEGGGGSERKKKRGTSSEESIMRRGGIQRRYRERILRGRRTRTLCNAC